MGPEEAGRAWELLRARVLVSDALGHVQADRRAGGGAAEDPRGGASGGTRERLWVLDVGETRPLV